MSSAFKTIGLIGKHHHYVVEETLHSTIDYLNTRKLDIFVEAETRRSLKIKPNIPKLSYPQLGKQCDLIISIGGDGCFLSAARAAVGYATPIVGINRGRLGFLTDISPLHINEKLDEIFAGKFQEETRFLLECSITDGDNMLSEGEALNDIVLSPGETAHLIEFDIYLNGDFVCHHRADGLIMATPTGSTAYALSGGGPILHPQLDALVLVPMLSHTLSSRPIVVHGNSVIELVINKSNETAPKVSCDGQARIAVPPGGKITLNKHKHLIRLLHPESYNFYDTLRSKLRWENK